MHHAANRSQPDTSASEEWAHTYQKIPKVVDEALAKSKAVRLTDRAETDVSSDKILDKFDAWQDSELWPALVKKFNTQSSGDAASAKALDLTVDVQTRSSLLRQETQLGEVT